MFQVGPACYSTAVEAASAVASSLVGSIIVIGSNAYTIAAPMITDTLISYRFNLVGGTAFIDAPTAYAAVPCGLLTVADGLAVGWMVGGAWLAVYALLFITRGLRDSSGGSYGNS